MSTSKEDFIKREIEKTGFDFEDKVTSKIKELGNFDVQTSYDFIDWQTGEPLELDVRATYKVTSSPIQIEYVLLIECEKVPGNAWAFIKSTGDAITSKNALSMWDDIDTISRQQELVEILKPMTKVNAPVADSYSNRFKEIVVDSKIPNNRDNNIINCTRKLAKVIYFEKRAHERNNAILATQVEDIDNVKIYYPMIVFDGDIYEATMLPSLKVRQISSVHLNKLSIENKQEIQMTIDVVNFENLQQFLKKGLLVEAREILSREKGNRQAYINRIHKLKQKQRLNKRLQQIEGVYQKVQKVPKVGKIL